MPNPENSSKKAHSSRPSPIPGSISSRLADTMARLALDEASMAGYLGVPVFTLRKWITGERVPGAAVVRLLDVLGTIETVAPAIHDGLMPTRID